jgi:hypothetical protein
VAESETAKAVETTTYHRDRLVAEAAEFFDGVPSYVVSAALGATKGNKTHFTRDDAEKAIKAFNEHVAEMSYDTEGVA